MSSFFAVAFLVFLAGTCLAYFVLPKAVRPYWLLVCSYLFYMYDPENAGFVALLLSASAVTWAAALLLERLRVKWMRRVCLVVSLALCVGCLFYYKYFNFLGETLAALLDSFGLHYTAPSLDILAPVGISYFTFAALGYVIDVYRGDAPAQRSLIDLAAYIAMFPQLVAGPIVRYTDVAPQLQSRTHAVQDAALGARRFVLGLGKKVLLANVLYELVTVYQQSGQKTVLLTWMYAAAYMMHVYFDFSGYSDMAIGLGRIMGFRFAENFNYPFISGSLTEFWRRWHISLGSWFRDYVYIPLGGSRVRLGRWVLNLLVVWGLTGLWHGAAWTFVLWGLYFAVFLLMEKLFLGRLLRRLPVLRHVYVLTAALFSFVLFDASSLSAAIGAAGAMLGLGHLPMWDGGTLYYLHSYAPVLLAAAVGSTPLPAVLCRRMAAGRAGRVLDALEPIALLALLAVCTAFLVSGSANPFLYFRF